MRLKLYLGCLLFALFTGNASAAPLVIGGSIVTSGGVIPHAWIVIDNRKIVSITTTQPAPAGAQVLVTDDLIFPGFVDLHNHPLYNVIPRWTPPKRYANRYEWRSSAAYRDAISTPQRKLADAGLFCQMDEFAEVKALIGGTTSFIGIFSATPPPCAAGLVRNLDLISGFYPPGAPERIRNEIGITAKDLPDARAVKLAGEIAAGSVDLLAIHIGEGLRSDPPSADELNQLDAKGLLTAHTAIVHGAALTSSDFAKMHAAGAALIWSPRSNIELYGETTDIASAVANGVRVALAPDWSPSGSDNTLAELRYAASMSSPGIVLTPERLFEMATAEPARIAHIDDKVGTLAPGLYADLFLVAGDGAKPFDTLAAARPQDVALVVIDGEPVYGTKDNLASLGVAATEDIEVCGAPHALNSAALPSGPLQSVMAKLSLELKKHGSALAPLAECVP